MIGWPIRSALLIDYENVAHRTLPDTIPNWVVWLERGEFDAGTPRRRRRFVTKRIYWNSAAQHLRPTFERFGCSCVLCEKFAVLKNGVDIRMAMDIVEFTRDMPGIKGFVLLTRDSDCVPMLKMLRQQKRRTAVLVDPRSPTVFTTYRTHADTVIPLQDFLQATSYLGKNDYRALMEEIAKSTDKRRLTFPSGGVSVMYVPKDEVKGQLRVKRRRMRRRSHLARR
jgi:hypothetical protein